MEMIDFSNCKLSNREYGGSEKKIGIVYDNDNWILKFPKVVSDYKTLSHVSEYLASHIFELLKVPVHETRLGYYKGEEVVALRDFTKNGEYTLVEFSCVGESSIDTDVEKHASYDYEDILYLLDKHVKANKKQTIERFWDMFIIDALVANFDRHGYNWGFLKNLLEYTLADVYDNGASLFPRLREDELSTVLNTQEELDRRTFRFPNSQIKLKGKKSSYYEVISSHQFEGCDQALRRIYNRIDGRDLYDLVSSISCITQKRKQFYLKILEYRYVNIIKASYDTIPKRCSKCGRVLTPAGRCADFNCEG